MGFWCILLLNKNHLSHYIIRLFLIFQMKVTNESSSKRRIILESEMNYHTTLISKHIQYYFEPILI